jgi:preprotein translocase subunit YajC
VFNLISTALADAAQPVASAKDSFASLVPMFVIFFIFYFLLIRPQAKKQREHALFLKQLNIGDKIIVSGSLIGHITRINTDEDTVQVELAPGTFIEVIKNSITSLATHEKNTNVITNKVKDKKSKLNKTTG